MAQSGSLERLYQTYKDRVNFLVVYIREAHPDSIIAVPGADGRKQLQVVAQTSSVAERLENLKKMLAVTGMTMPAVIDDFDNSVKRAYAAWPDRLYVLDAEGKVAYKGRPGPFGFRTPELEAWLRQNAK